MLKPGYKQTEVGIIPEDWEVVTLDSITVNIGDGIHSTPIFTPNNDYYFVNGNNIRNGHIVITEDTKTVSYTEFKKHHKSLTNGTILMSINGTIGSLGFYKDQAIVLGKSAAYLTIRDYVSKTLVYYILQTEVVQRQFNNGLTGTTIKNLGLGTIRQSFIPLPPTLEEQRAIAEALSDADALIESLEQLIAKKRAIKQGAMQELLRPKEGWVKKKLGEIAFIKTGSRNNQDKTIDGKYPFFVRSSTVERINTYSYDCEAILIPGEGNIGSIFHYISGRFDLHQRVYGITEFSQDTVSKYIYFYMVQYFGTYALQNTVKATVDSLRLPTFQNFEVFIPHTLGEQTTIATILSDMDSEIAALEAKLSKAQQVKQGMMQELLTGKTRLLPSSSSAHEPTDMPKQLEVSS